MTREETELALRAKVIARFKKGITRTMVAEGKKIKNYQAFIAYCAEKDSTVNGLAWIATAGWKDEP